LVQLQDKKGLTIVELVVVIGILSLVLSIVLPRLDTGTYRLLAASKTLRDDIRYVRYMKMTEGQNLRILFQRKKYHLLQGTKVVKEVTLESDFSLYQNFKDGQIAFSFNGGPSTSGGTATLVNNKDKKYCEVTVVPGTGRIILKNQVYNGYK